MSDGNGSTAIELAKPVDLMPALSINESKHRRDQMVQFVQAIMVPQVDFGKIPGTDKDTLLKPGAEKLCTFFGLTKRFTIEAKVEDWTGKDHGGEPFFYYLYRCQLYRGDKLIAESDGSANSWETKYRYRNAQRVCPDCGKATIIKGKAEYGGGFICFAKKGGCGAKYLPDDPKITGQNVGRVPNPDVADQVNTLQKMAQKRALVGTTLLAVNASEFFTQDVEDMQPVTANGGDDVIDSEVVDHKPRGRRVVEEEPDLSDDRVFQPMLGDAFRARGFTEPQGEAAIKDMLARGYKVESLADLDAGQRAGMLQYIAAGKADKYTKIQRGIQEPTETPPTDALPRNCQYEQICEIALEHKPKDLDAGDAVRGFESWLKTAISKKWDKVSRDEQERVFRGIKAGEPWAMAPVESNV
jgi:hypothetical protein